MALTPAQLQTLKTNIAASGDMNTLPNNDDGNFTIAALYNAASSPAFVVWKSLVSLREVGVAFNGTELAGLTTANNTRLQTVGMYLSGGVNPSSADNRQFFDDVFSGAGGANTRAALLALWKRTATRGEAVFATGTGSDASPGTLTFEGRISMQDVSSARNLP